MNNFTVSKRNLISRILTYTGLFFATLSMQFNAFANDVAGKTILAKGQVLAIDEDSKKTRQLKRRSEIFSVDNISTGNKSKAQFSMSDGGLITLKENTEILISNYQFNPDAGEASATLEVVSGGLRSISGLIKKSGGDYQVKTPVGSIGIRGTHFAVEVVGDDVFFAVYSGNIDVQLNDQSTLSLGGAEDFNFAAVNAEGEITRMTQAPANISLGYSAASDNEDEANSEEGNAEGDALAQESSTSPLNSVETELDAVADNSVYTESEWQGMTGTAIEELLAQRTGTLDYSDVIQSSVVSSVGQVSDFAISMTIDFDNASVPGGTLSFSDSEGEWFAAYSGLINMDQLDLGINFASHGNNRADGIIFASFANGLDEIIGGFNLHEINNPPVNAGGSFKIQP
ncbi:FecR family protein [Colwellia chukchiensis]|uniref:FecR family protein n=1 Tax=Colwellia chukchiensis TaxID=641665 RepID=A0A1H7TXW6_9GAMM|nr:FecR family protein [Colwellia chukchiensis]SEL89591.1 FecR family protein [Colwellia chukchiensis]